MSSAELGRSFFSLKTLLKKDNVNKSCKKKSKNCLFVWIFAFKHENKMSFFEVIFVSLQAEIATRVYQAAKFEFEA